MKKVSIIIPVYNVDKTRFKRTLESLAQQTYKDFEVCISDGNKDSSVEKIIEKYNKRLAIKYKKSDKNLGISDNTNQALELATGEYISLLDHDDLLYENAIEESINKIEEGFDLVYSDEEIIDDNYNVLNTMCKPNFSPDLLYSQNYICHFTTIRKTIVDKVGKFNSKYDGAQDYDYFLRVFEETNKIGHIDKILYRWLSTPESTSTNAQSKPYAQTAGLNALKDHIKRKYGNKASVYETDNLFVYRVEYNLLDNKLIDIIIPMKDKWSLTKNCVDSILEKTSYNNYQITILDNNSEEKLTLEWLDEINKNKKVRVLKADFEFNWSKLQNFGIENSKADIFVFLNNDTIIIDENWLNVLGNTSLKENTGVVGPLLLYEDGTIQHAGVVVGFGGYADHIYKGCSPIHEGVNYISPMVCRNVLAVTGACMAISRKTLDKIGYFNEDFIICGSDVEICIRAYENGLYNVYTPFTKLVHLESKSRDSYVPPVDFRISKIFYKKYWENGDPFYNNNLSRNSFKPKLKTDEEIAVEEGPSDYSIKSIIKKLPLVHKTYRFIKETLKKNAFAVIIYRKIKRIEVPSNEHYVCNTIAIDYTVPEIRSVHPIECKSDFKKRINILIPSLNKDKVFGGIATAMKFFSKFDDSFEKRIVVVDTPMKDDDLDNYKDYTYVSNEIQCDNKYQVVNISDKDFCNLVVSPNDIFIATAWWTAYSIRPIIKWQKEFYNLKDYKKLIYFIQDYEPYFYPWSSKQCCAESTYRMDIPTIGVFNSKELLEYFDNHNYEFDSKYCFGPVLNDNLKKHLIEDEEIPRKKQIVIYGRPNTARNAFEIINEALIKAFKKIEDYKEWKIISMGEEHIPAFVKNGLIIKSVGKLTLDEYAKKMEESYLGISLMVSPHPSYPPLEMSSFGIKTITNQYENKDMSYFNENIISVEHCDADSIAEKIIEYVNNYDKYVKTCKKVLNEEYVNSGDQFDPIIKKIDKVIK